MPCCDPLTDQPSVFAKPIAPAPPSSLSSLTLCECHPVFIELLSSTVAQRTAIMSTKAARQAWNEAMRSAGQKLPGTSTTRRSSDRRRKQSRRDRARKSTAGGNDDGNADSAMYRAAARIDILEDILDDADNEDEEEYDELEEMEGGGGGGGKAGSKRKRRGGGGGGSAASKRAAGGISARLKARSLASILLEETARADGVTKEYLEAESQPPPKGTRPKRKFCPVTGLMGVYTEPKSGIPYANLKALEQIRERAPPWTNRGGSAAYSEAMKSLRDD